MNVGRNDPCPCGSGKKYKKCCGVKAFQHGPEPEERLRRRLIRDLLAFASSREFTIEHQRALLRYWPGSAGLSPNQALARMKPEWVQASFWEWYVHDFRLRDGRTFIDHFIIRRASMLTARERAFLEGARRTFRSLYQVLEVRPEEGLTLRDLFLGGTVDVRERVATRTLQVGRPRGKATGEREGPGDHRHCDSFPGTGSGGADVRFEARGRQAWPAPS